MSLFRNAIEVFVGALIVLLVLWDGIETIILPRTVSPRKRLTRWYYLIIARFWYPYVRTIKDNRQRETLLGAFGPISLVCLFVFWAGLLITGFTLVHSGIHSLHAPHRADVSIGTYFYFSGVTFLTLGYGDVTPTSSYGRFLAVVEAGVGFGFLAIVIGYLPVLYSAFSRRETAIALLDARAGTPPTAARLLQRYAAAESMEGLIDLLRDQERWASELLESYLSYPILSFYRSQHDGQSWLAALTAVMDTCALLKTGVDNQAEWKKPLLWQAQLTFAMARHTIVDLSLILDVPPTIPPEERLPYADWELLRTWLETAGIRLTDTPDAHAHLEEIRRQYEPYVYAISKRIYLTLPPFIEKEEIADNWQTSAWDHQTHLY